MSSSMSGGGQEVPPAAPRFKLHSLRTMPCNRRRRRIFTSGGAFASRPSRRLSAIWGSSSSSSLGDGIKPCPRCSPKNCWKTSWKLRRVFPASSRTRLILKSKTMPLETIFLLSGSSLHRTTLAIYCVRLVSTRWCRTRSMDSKSTDSTGWSMKLAVLTMAPSQERSVGTKPAKRSCTTSKCLLSAWKMECLACRPKAFKCTQ
mmetsp:Transcript_175147/g.556311  ORF Transcript_175147/g.556311 Transcript_175147/m.556311 type:complete len:203 (-) Transcript_175147:292-900(-)